MNRIERIAESLVSQAFRLWPQPRPSTERLRSAQLVAHRGVHEAGCACENSLEAFRSAVDHGIWGIEFDVRFTRDGVPVVLHDPDCLRLFERRDLVLEKCDFTNLRKALPQIPSFAEVVAEFKGRLHFMIEVKEDLRSRPTHVETLREILRPLQPELHYHVMALQPDYLEALTFLPKRACMDIIWLNRIGVMRRHRELGHGAISGHFLMFSNRVVAAYQATGTRLGVGFIDSRYSLFRELNRGIDYIFTNHPITLKNIIKKELGDTP